MKKILTHYIFMETYPNPFRRSYYTTLEISQWRVELFNVALMEISRDYLDFLSGVEEMLLEKISKIEGIITSGDGKLLVFPHKLCVEIFPSSGWDKIHPEIIHSLVETFTQGYGISATTIQIKDSSVEKK